MRTTSTFKLRLLEMALREEIGVSVRIRGDVEWLKVISMKNLGHSLMLTLDRNAGFIVVEPDEIGLVRVPKLPAAFQKSSKPGWWSMAKWLTTA